jgi:S-adenosylmethionine-dependent methyltransferase
MTKITADLEGDRFRSGASKYAAYLETPEGRLRLDLAFATLQEFLPQSARPLRALDVGGGTGAMAVRLAQLGLHLTVLDESLPMLDGAKRAAQESGVAGSIVLKSGNAAALATLFEPGSFDLILCHNILEYVDNPLSLLRGAARVLRDSMSIISILVRNQAGEVLKAAIKDGDLAQADRNLTAEWGHESLYGGSVRLFSAETLKTTLATASLEVIGTRGVRVLSDYFPPCIDRNAEYDRIFKLERKLGARPEFAAMARYTHCLVHRPGPIIKDAV